MPYTGQMSTEMLNDRQIRAKDFTRWRHAHSRFARGRDRDTVDAYKAEITSGGLRTLIWLDVSERTGEVLIGDGHHRAVALLELGVARFPFHWRVAEKAGWLSQPPLEPGPFPYHLLGLGVA